jgi:hypothetical protein
LVSGLWEIFSGQVEFRDFSHGKVRWYLLKNIQILQ